MRALLLLALVALANAQRQRQPDVRLSPLCLIFSPNRLLRRVCLGSPSSRCC